MDFFAKSDIGIKREENQDSYGFTEKTGEYLLSVVCDGMGGMAGGKTAAKLAVKTFLSRFGFFYSERIEASGEVKAFDIKRIFSNAVYSANKAICDEAEKDESLFGMGSTLTSAFIYGNRLYTSNVGDSRIYLIRGDEISQLTKDNSFVQELLDQGIIDEEDARNHPRRNLITKALGASREIEPEYTATDLEEGDLILLCTDGLTNAVTDGEIKEIANKTGTLEEKVNALITYANERGGDDNVTAVLIKI
jgi:protein phosphatase